MGFARHIRLEIRNILKSRFLFIMAIVALLASLAVPTISYLNQQGSSGNNGYSGGKDLVYTESTMARAAIGGLAVDGPIYGGKGQPITINGVTIGMENPLYWNLQSLMSERDMLGQGKNPFSTPAALDLALQLFDEELAYYLPFAQHITASQDYRMELVQRGIQNVYERFFYKNGDKGVKLLEEVAGYRKFIDPATIKAKYVEITAEKQLAGLDAAESQLTLLTSIVVSNDFPKYIDLRIKLANDEITTLEEIIAGHEQTIISNATQEETLSQVIADTRRQIDAIQTGTIPVLEYRLARNIVPGLDIWQNNALNDIEQSKSQLAYLKIPTEAEWHTNQGMYSKMTAEAQTYREYVANMQAQIDTLNKRVIVAQKSLDSERPDLKYVPGGARRRTIDFLQYSAIITLYGVLLGGWLIASEHQQGTIRLLMIRPRTRTKILLAKFTAAIAVWLAVGLLSSLLNLIANGALFGVADFANPSYTVAGQTGFLAYYLPKLMACITPTLFAFSFAFMLSVVSRNIAVSIILPVVLYIVSVIAQSFFIYGIRSSWLDYTPLPYMQMASFFSIDGMYETVARRGVNLTYGILLLLGLSALLMAFSVIVFKKRDIVN